LAWLPTYYGGKIIAAREALLRLPGELGDQLAAETNAAKVAEVLDGETRRILETLATSGPSADTRSEGMDDAADSE
jgi:hypothetical protein